MAIALYDATVPTFLQLLACTRTVLEKGLAHAQASGIDPDSLVEARLFEDMLPLSFQVQSTCGNTAGALRDVSKGAYTIGGERATTYAGLQQQIAEAEAAVQGWTREAVEALAGGQVVLEFPGSRIEFTAEAFFLSFSLPNANFHAVTTYDILRMKGVPLGKRDFLGAMRFKI